MTTPARPYAPDPYHPDQGVACCDGHNPLPRWYLVGIPAPVRRHTLPSDWDPAYVERLRQLRIAAFENPDRLWCPTCSTALEDVRDELSDLGPAYLSMVATIVSFVPGFGTAAAIVLETIAGLARGEKLSQILVDDTIAAIPGGAAWTGVANAAGGVVKGERLDRAFSDGARAAIAEEGGPLAAAAYDAVIAVAQGKSIQDAGFAGLNALVKGNSLAERAAAYAEQVTVALEQGKGLPEVLVTALATELYEAAGDQAEALVAGAVKRLQVSRQLLAVGSDVAAAALGVAEPVARAAQAILRNGGIPDRGMQEAISGSVDEQRRAALFAQTAVAVPVHLSTTATKNLDAATQRAALLSSTAVAVPGALDVLSRVSLKAPIAQRLAVSSPVLVGSAAQKLAVLAPASVPAVAAAVKAAAPSSSNTGAAGDLALGGVVLAAGVALFLWARSK